MLVELSFNFFNFSICKDQFNMFLFVDTICNNYSLLHIQNMNIFATPFFDSKFLTNFEQNANRM